MELRPYQSDAVAAIYRAWEASSSTLAVMPTGTGKTVVLAHVIEQRPSGKAMLIAHREELIWQGAKKITAVTGEQPAVEMAEYLAPQGLCQSNVVVSSVQTLNAGENGFGRMVRFDPNEFSLLIVDESHHATAKSYRRVLQHFRQNPRLKILGVTATPDRADEEALGQIFETVAFEYELPDAIHDGWLVPIVQRAVHVAGLDYSSIRTTCGELNGADLARVLEFEAPIHEMIQATLEITMRLEPGALSAINIETDPEVFRRRMDDVTAAHPPRKTLVFAASVSHAERFAEVINRWLPMQARFVCGDTDKEIRREMLRDYAADRFPFLVNVGVATEGFDDPGIEVVVMGRPTKSRALYAQMAGRGTRVHPAAGVDRPGLSADDRRALIASSAKPGVEIVDFVGNCGRHQLITTSDILGGNFSDEVVERARKNIEASGEPKDTLEALDEAQREIQEEKAKATRLALRVQSKYVSQILGDPFAMMGIEPWKERGWHKGRQPTENQLSMLERAGVPIENVKTFTQASQLIDTIIKRRDERQCTYKQARLLVKHGYHGQMTFDQAKDVIDTLAKNGWRRADRPKREIEVY